MKKIILAFVIIFGITLLTACSSSKRGINNVEVNIGESVRFTEKEIEQAIDIVIEDFFKDAEHIELHSLSYDEEYSDSQIKDYREDIDRNNMIIISSDFYVDSKAGGAWNPDSDYNWMFILSRDDKESGWNLDGWGY